MSDVLTLDTNVLYYALDPAAGAKNAQAHQIIQAAATRSCILTAQSLGELYSAATRKLKLTKRDAERHVRDLMQVFAVADTTAPALGRALSGASSGKFSLWDAVVLSAAADAGCTICLSEDMHDGAKFGPIVVRNPFGASGLSKAAVAALGA